MPQRATRKSKKTDSSKHVSKSPSTKEDTKLNHSINEYFHKRETNEVSIEHKMDRDDVREVKTADSMAIPFDTPSSRGESVSPARPNIIEVVKPKARGRPPKQVKEINESTPKKERSVVSGANKSKSQPKEQTKQLTDFFQVRKSTRRKTAKQLKREGSALLQEKVLAGCEDGLKIKIYPGKGRGIEASKYFLKGDYVVEYAGDLLDVKEARARELEYKKDSDVGSYMYFFSHRDKSYCMDATAESGKLGRLLNHSRLNPNCTTKTIDVDEKPRLVIVALKDIEPGEEMLYDYGDRSKESVQENPWLLL